MYFFFKSPLLNHGGTFPHINILEVKVGALPAVKILT